MKGIRTVSVGGRFSTRTAKSGVAGSSQTLTELTSYANVVLWVRCLSVSHLRAQTRLCPASTHAVDASAGRQTTGLVAPFVARR